MEEMRGLLTAISRAFARSSLVDLTDNQCERSDEIDPSIFVIPYHLVQLLRCFLNLTMLALTSPLGFDLDNDVVSELARVWPQIVTLRLRVRFPMHRPAATLSCLALFAQHCPNLSRLTIAFDETTVQSPEVEPSCPTSAEDSASSIRRYPLPSPLLVSSPAYSGSHPHRNTSRVCDDEDELLEHGEAIRLYNRWKEMLALLPEVAAIREEGWKLGQATSTS